MSAWPLMAASGYLLIDYLLPTWNQDTVVLEVDNSHYLWYSDEVWSKPDKWKLYSAIMLSSCASLLSSYSAYAAEEDYYNAVDPGYGDRYGQKLELAELLAVPWRCENVFNFDVFPAFPMFVLLSLEPADFRAAAEFFTRDTVPFLGMDVHPTAGLAMALGSSLLLANMSTVAEEISFRGHLLRRKGLHVSSIIFGGAHLGNMVMPNTSIENTLLQTVFATLFGYYAADRTIKNGYDFRNMIALHFWHNVAAMTLNYLICPDYSLYFSLGISLSY